MYWLLGYDYVEDIVTRREPWRDAHLAFARAAHERGELLLAGAVGDPVEGAVFVFTGDDSSAAGVFAAHDPYVEAGLVTRWQVQPWNVVIGG